MSIKESDLLKWLVANAKAPSDDIVEGVRAQDDAAIIKIQEGFDICATTDFVRGTGFLLFREGHLTLSDLGHYVVGANVSDLAAMGAIPKGYLSVVRYDNDRSEADVHSLLKGISEACERTGCELIGGDIGSYHADVLSGTAFGIVESNRALRRDALTENMAVFVSGDLGRPAAAMAAVSKGIQENCHSVFNEALQKWKRPQPRVDLGRALVQTGLTIAAMDVSDGLSASLQQLARINNLGFEILEENIPINACVFEIAEAAKNQPLHIACGASVDFELLFAAPAKNIEKILELGNLTNTPISHIGFTTENNAIKLKNRNGGYWDSFPGIPWDHQVKDVRTMF